MIANAAADEAIPVARGNDDWLEAAVRAHSRVVYRIAYSALRDPAEAEDVTQETFLRALRFGKKFKAVHDPKAWLARVAWRLAVERRQRNQRAVAMADGADDQIPAPGPGAERQLLEGEREQMLATLIAGLPESLRDPLVLSAIEELSPREIAEALAVSEAAVRSRAFRARQILRERLTAWIGPGRQV